MARITHVKAAQQRYATVPVIDPATGEQKRTPVMSGGVQKVSKRGPVFMRVTRDDKSQPLPNRNCGLCGTEIKVGDPYKHVTPKSGPYGGTTRYRCGTCPNWQVWDLSNSLSARTAQIEHDLEQAIDDAGSEDDVTSACRDAASSVQELADEKREGAENIEEGFGHATEQSDELNSTADELEGWVQELESFAPADFPEPDECDECDGTGEIEADEEGKDPETCDTCNGSGTPEEPTDEQIDEWRSSVRDDLPTNPI